MRFPPDAAKWWYERNSSRQAGTGRVRAAKPERAREARRPGRPAGRPGLPRENNRRPEKHRSDTLGGRLTSVIDAAAVFSPALCRSIEAAGLRILRHRGGTGAARSGIVVVDLRTSQ